MVGHPWRRWVTSERTAGSMRPMPENDARETWDARYAAGRFDPSGPPAWLDELGEELPREGLALDLAAGAGRISIWLARRGLSVEAVDISPVGLALAREAASDEGVRIRTHVTDLAREAPPDGPYAFVACFHYRQPGLLVELGQKLSPGGILVAEQATVRNLERHERPSKRWLGESNELLREAGGLEVAYYREAWLGGRHLARLVARARAQPPGTSVAGSSGVPPATCTSSGTASGFVTLRGT